MDEPTRPARRMFLVSRTTDDTVEARIVDSDGLLALARQVDHDRLNARFRAELDELVATFDAEQQAAAAPFVAQLHEALELTGQAQADKLGEIADGLLAAIAADLDVPPDLVAERPLHNSAGRAVDFMVHNGDRLSEYLSRFTGPGAMSAGFDPVAFPHRPISEHHHAGQLCPLGSDCSQPSGPEPLRWPYTDR